MGWLSDALRIVCGMDEDLRAWRDSISAAEHHLRWGIESRQQRDFERALEILAKCPKSDSASPHCRYRRERASAEAHLWLGRLAMDRLAEQLAKVDDYFEAVEEGRRSLRLQLESTRERVRSLEADGSLISAREERRRLEDLERETGHMPDLSAEKRERRAAVLARISPTFENHRSRAEEHLAALRAISALAPEDLAARDEIAKKQESGLAALDS
ncbi:MAG TPA: hypothetical protein PK280_06895, partial [Planctomycetota bacterium]|nr:hypothetical protein [Planctomycetota bacterium]